MRRFQIVKRATILRRQLLVVSALDEGNNSLLVDDNFSTEGGDAASTTFTPLKINKCNPATMRERAENESKGRRVWKGSLMSLTGISFFKKFMSAHPLRGLKRDVNEGGIMCCSLSAGRE